VEIQEDGRPQQITNFSFVSTESGVAQPVAVKPKAPADKLAPPVPPVRLRPEQVRRTVALVVDDLGLSFESAAFVRRALKKFVDEQVQPGDLVAIIRTGGGIGALQQFTSDKRQLYAAVERVRWNPAGRAGVSAFAAIEPDLNAEIAAQRPDGNSDEDDAQAGQGGDDLDRFREELFAVGTLGAVNYVVRGMRELPGRKSILLVSDGIRIFDRRDPSRSRRVLDSLDRLTDLANRASVVIYTMDARGLPTLGLTAADNTSGRNMQQVQTALADRSADFSDSQAGLIYLSQQTGGFAIRNTNDLSAGMKTVLEDQKGYYLIGYRPDESTFDPATGRRKFHKISLKIKRPGLKHRTRTGFYGITDEQAVPQRRTRTEQMIGALTSPFSEGGVRLRLTSIYGNDPKAGSFLRSLIHIEARDLTFTEEADGWRKTIFDVLAITFGDNGAVIDQIGRTQTVRIRGETYKHVLENGFIFDLAVPVKKPGAYQLRAALRDSVSERVGSATQFIEVPDVNKNRLTLSGIVVSGYDPSAAPGGAQKQQPPAGASSQSGDEVVSDQDPQAGPAVRKFKSGMLMNYGYAIYNARVDRASARPQLQTQMRMFRDGKQVFAGRVQSFDASGQTDLKRIAAGGALQLGKEMQPGEYVLQIVVTDLLAKDKYRTTTQWIDFEMVR
jgi:VWFA-related protein